MNHYVDAIDRYFIFSGRSSRAQYWVFVLINSLLFFGFSLLDRVLGSDLGQSVTGVFGGLYSLFAFVPSWSVQVRRLHDVNRSGWLLLLPLTMAAGFPLLPSKPTFAILVMAALGFFSYLYLFALTVTPGDKGPNRYGSDPYGREAPVPKADTLQPAKSVAQSWPKPPLQG